MNEYENCVGLEISQLSAVKSSYKNVLRGVEGSG